MNIYRKAIANLDELLYIVNLDTMELVYVSPKIEKKLGTYAAGCKCHKYMENTDSPCIGCPAEYLDADNNEMSIDRYCPSLFTETNYRYIYTDDDGVRNLVVILSVDKARTHVNEKRKDDAYKTIIDVLRLVSTKGPLKEKLPKCLKDIKDFYRAESCHFYQIENDEDFVDDIAWGDKNILFSDDRIRNEWHRYFSETIILNKASLGTLPVTRKYMEMIGLEDILGIAVKKAGKIKGYLYLINPTQNQDFETLLKATVPHIEGELEEESDFTELDRLANTDILTGLRNRCCYDRQIQAIEKENVCVGVIYIDINGLKQGNDTYGHEYGDRMIKETANRLKGAYGNNTYRIGGDEFVILIPKMEEKTFCENVNEFRSNWNPDISISVGSKWFREAVNLEKKIDMVDALMYREKMEYHKTHDRRKAE